MSRWPATNPASRPPCTLKNSTRPFRTEARTGEFAGLGSPLRARRPHHVHDAALAVQSPARTGRRSRPRTSPVPPSDSPRCCPGCPARRGRATRRPARARPRRRSPAGSGRPVPPRRPLRWSIRRRCRCPRGRRPRGARTAPRHCARPCLKTARGSVSGVGGIGVPDVDPVDRQHRSRSLVAGGQVAGLAGHRHHLQPAAGGERFAVVGKEAVEPPRPVACRARTRCPRSRRRCRWPGRRQPLRG